jgi:hypothetical protein
MKKQSKIDITSIVSETECELDERKTNLFHQMFYEEG